MNSNHKLRLTLQKLSFHFDRPIYWCEWSDVTRFCCVALFVDYSEIGANILFMPSLRPKAIHHPHVSDTNAKLVSARRDVIEKKKDHMGKFILSE